jgi:hypothetical protein
MTPDRLVLADLDDTLFSTARKQGELGCCTLVALNKKGEPSSWQNPAQEALWTWLQAFGAIVPVTARNRKALERVNLPLSRHAVWNHGASVAIDGVLDAEWQATIQADLDAMEATGVWDRLTAALTTWIAQDPALEGTVLRNSAHAEFNDCRFQLEIKNPGIGRYAPALVRLVQATVGNALWVYPHTDVIALLPHRVRKETGAARLLDRLKPAFTVGVGDSPTDLPFMRLCDTVVAPRRSLLVQMAAAEIEGNYSLPAFTLATAGENVPLAPSVALA